MKKYSDLMADWLVDLGYTHCFFLGGGNIMHLLESCSHRFTCIPVVHEVAAGIAAEYLTELGEGKRAFALVTAGPGFTNVVTAMAAAFLESHELLVIGGQVKVADLSLGRVRQRGIQEADGVALATPISVKSVLMDRVIDQREFNAWTQAGSSGRKGPVFVEVPLDVQGTSVDEVTLSNAERAAPTNPLPSATAAQIAEINQLLERAERPVVLLGGGIDRRLVRSLLPQLEKAKLPLMVTWNGMDRVPSDHPYYFGRPNTFGQRSANIIQQQADLVIALGTRLGLQQTGFNWQQFAPMAKVVQVEIDERELTKGHPRVDLPVLGDANEVLRELSSVTPGNWSEWIDFARMVRREVPLVDPQNVTASGYLSPFEFNDKLSAIANGDDIVIPCSSGGAYTSAMQVWELKRGQISQTTKGLASMGYGLGGAIGAALAWPERRTILMEGDGGFSQNLQELGTVRAQKLNLKIFINDDHGYASIRMSQINYFKGHYVGCDIETGLGLPDWNLLFPAYSIPVMTLKPGFETDPEFLQRFNTPGPAAFLVSVDPKQTYFPKIMSRITEAGSMESNPLHFMSPDLEPEVAAKVYRYISGDTGAKVTK
ncbi:thiamine pyrophosphate-dependent enzyme, possible carboligase or decarboxylase [Terriglobus roseus DSM 18391]|uniref:Thiamine pyrophosphate-dependent enzyme, possible carboligase or decarboxylase n=1 Tax=Terriglobus roseus (strain DSM 18391 / NRRL B-41598 / KBS 63) TaxID=926566 RepID=I3ZFB7_TERRK|nr:thiamine pyrophosphate-binding protein [Terriglobus roseus]AFL87935.1 thiamine pyrophosphate-dependent enzyme, possible carboligase or decarboxylase [Terriglobus roseus DSM 18391]